MRTAALAGFLIIGCALSAAAQPKLTAEPDQNRSDTALLQDEAKATSAFQQRLRDKVSVSGALLVIENHDGDATSITVIPKTMTWAVDCSDSGLNVTFGSGTAETDIGVTLQLTAVAIPADKCRKIAPAIGQTVLALTKGE